MSRYWSPVVATLSPYVPGEQPKVQNLVKLNTNEHPYGSSPKVLAAIRAACDDSLKLYPDPASDRLRQAIATNFSVQADQVFLGNGSDEVLAHVFQALLKHDKPLKLADVTYRFYLAYCGLYAISHQTVPLTEDFQISVDDYLPTDGESAGGIIFPNPNAPTGRALSLGDIERIVAGNPRCSRRHRRSLCGLWRRIRHSACSVLRQCADRATLSKSRSLAGLRIGFAVSSRALIEGLERVKNSFNSYPIDRLASIGDAAAIEDLCYFNRMRQTVIQSRERLSAGLQAKGFQVLPSLVNFVFARHPEHDPANLAEALRERGIIVRHFHQERISQFLRITVGTDEQCTHLLDALTQLVAI